MSFKDGNFEFKESQRLEFKEAAGGLPDDVWETYSAFANTEGGEIVLGVAQDPSSESFIPVGVSDPDGIFDKFWNDINNPSLVGRNILLADDVVNVMRDGFDFVVISVPRAERDQKPVYVHNKRRKRNVAWVRRGTGDREASENDAALMRYDNTPSADRAPLNRFDISALCDETIAHYRNVFAANKPQSPWNSDSKEDFLYHIGALAKGRDGKLVPTQAGLLAFGYEYEIASLFPDYLLDYRVERDDGRRWSDRVVSQSGDWSGNIVDFYFLVTGRFVRFFDMPFSTDSTGTNHSSNNPITEAVNEALTNALVHAYYGPSATVRVIMHHDELEITNPGSLLLDQDVAIAGGFSISRNPTLMKIMSLIGASDRAGSGLQRIWSVWSSFREPPSLEEQHSPALIKLMLPIREALEKNTGTSADSAMTYIPSKHDDRILELIAVSPKGITSEKVSQSLGISDRIAQKRLKALYDSDKVGRIRRAHAFAYIPKG